MTLPKDGREGSFRILDMPMHSKWRLCTRFSNFLHQLTDQQLPRIVDSEADPLLVQFFE